MLCDSQGFMDFKFFILSDDRAIIDKILYNVNGFNKKDNKINLVTVLFSVNAYEKLEESEIKALTETAQDLFHTLAEFAKYNSVTNEMKLVCVDDELQKLSSDSCRNCQLYFYKNLFDPAKNSKIQKHDKFTKKTIDTSLNEIFTSDLDEYERRVAQFSK